MWQWSGLLPAAQQRNSRNEQGYTVSVVAVLRAQMRYQVTLFELDGYQDCAQLLPGFGAVGLLQVAQQHAVEIVAGDLTREARKIMD
ncbi:MAG: hypothetical protein QOI59_6896 [Gammaproteobacteria bacterium]|nr:hypothetical protein [Gammaproteobacteria bacterium]